MSPLALSPSRINGATWSNPDYEGLDVAPHTATSRTNTAGFAGGIAEAWISYNIYRKTAASVAGRWGLIIKRGVAATDNVATIAHAGNVVGDALRGFIGPFPLFRGETLAIETFDLSTGGGTLDINLGLPTIRPAAQAS